MINNPLVSVIIPCYNHESYIWATLSSVLDDTYTNKEIIIINDGSKDNSNTEILKWVELNKDNVSITYLSRENKGICSTLNELISFAKGKYILPLASDDLLYNNTLAQRIEILEKNPDKLVLLSDAAVINAKGEIVFNSSMEEYHKVNKMNYKSVDGIITQTIKSLGISGATLLVNKEIYDIVGLYPQNLAAEDWYFYQRAASIGKILFWDKTVSLYRVHDANTSFGLNHKIYSAIIVTHIKNYYYFPKNKYKILAVQQIFRFSLIYLKVRIKAVINELC